MGGLLKPTDAVVAFDIYDDVDEPTVSRLMFTNRQNLRLKSQPDFETTRIVKFAGHSWVVHFSSTADFDRDAAPFHLRSLTVAGTIVALLIFAILQILTKQRDRVEARAQEMTKDLQVANAQLRLSASVFEHTLEGIIITDPDATIVEVNNAFTVLTGYEYEDAVGKTPSILQSGKHDDAFYKQLWDDLKTVGFWRGEVCNRKKDGSLFYELQTISAVPDGQGQTSHYVSIFSDITRMKEQEDQLRHHANYDLLTGLPNRRLLTEQMQKMLALAKREDFLIAVFYLDLDGFKAVNDRNDHSVGDALLVAIADRLSSLIRESDLTARLGGDEFVLLFSGVNELKDVERLAKKTLARLSDPYTIDGVTIEISASIGITIYPTDNAPAEFLEYLDGDELGAQFGEWVVNTALDQIDQWKRQGLKLRVSVNISARQFQQPGFVEALRSKIRQRPAIDPEDLEVEVLETTAINDIELTAGVILALRQLNIHVSIDDFGTGYSSLIYLKRLPADTLKIDQDFVVNILDSAEDLAIVEGVISLCSALSREVIAEGVDSEEHGKLLLRLGCELGQGYGIAKPMPASEFPDWARDYRAPESWRRASDT